MMKHSSCQFGDQFSGFGCQSEKFNCIGACIRHNFMPWMYTSMEISFKPFAYYSDEKKISSQPSVFSLAHV